MRLIEFRVSGALGLEYKSGAKQVRRILKLSTNPCDDIELFIVIYKSSGLNALSWRLLGGDVWIMKRAVWYTCGKSEHVTLSQMSQKHLALFQSKSLLV